VRIEALYSEKINFMFTFHVIKKIQYFLRRYQNLFFLYSVLVLERKIKEEISFSFKILVVIVFYFWRDSVIIFSFELERKML